MSRSNAPLSAWCSSSLSEGRMRMVFAALLLCLGVTTAQAQNSYTMPDGIGRAIPVVPTCPTGRGDTVVPCSGFGSGGGITAALPVPYVALGTGGNGPAGVTVGGSFQMAFPAGSIVHGAFLQNPRSATESLFVDHCGDLGAVSTACVEELAPGQDWETKPGLVPTAAVTVSAATSGHTLTGARY